MGLPELWLQLPDGGPPPIKNVFASRQSAFFTVFYFIIIVLGGIFMVMILWRLFLAVKCIVIVVGIIFAYLLLFVFELHKILVMDKV